VSRYGRAKETAYQLGKYSKEVKRDLEAILTSSQTSAAGSTVSAANMACFSAQVDASHLHKTGGSGTAMTETLLNTALQTLYTDGGEPQFLSIPPGEALNIASYAAVVSSNAATRIREVEGKTIVNAVEVYVSPFGEVKVVLNRFQPTIDHLLYQSDMWKLSVLRPWTRETLAKTGDATKMMIIGEFSLKHMNQKASSVVRKSA
jgi:hypothetical protein